MATKKIRFFGLKLQMNLIIYLYTVYTALKNSFPAAQHSREKKNFQNSVNIFWLKERINSFGGLFRACSGEN